MNRQTIIFFLFFTFFCAPLAHVFGQEQVGPIRYNAMINNRHHPAPRPAARTTSVTPLTLPFFEDFTSYYLFPDTTKWADFEVYIDNTMCVSPISRGAAIFDALNSEGIPYDSFSNVSPQYADSLTSLPIDLSSDSASDSVYLSFFYQAQGNGFAPEVGDSLELYFLDQFGEYELVWSIPGSIPGATLQPFQQVLIPITDSYFFHNAFQFRFVNIASLNWADANWMVDYIKLDKNRNINDTVIRDIGFSSDPTFLLNDYTSMPYRQFYADPVDETASHYYDSLRNNYDTTWPITTVYSATALTTGAILKFPTASASTSLPYSTQQLSYPSFSTTISPPGIDARVVFENTYYIHSVSPTDPTDNDTIKKDQVFDNYLAYDDGTAEKSYYLNLFPTLPGDIAIEYHLNQPDTMRGMAIYFGRQVPFASYKLFSIFVYSALAGINGSPKTVVLDSEELVTPAYADTINHFWIYTFPTPLLLPAGTFYAGTQQPAEGGSDSLYFGLDVNRLGPNHAYYNVIGEWVPSLISGAIMMRPLLGQYVASSASLAVPVIHRQTGEWQITPNPAREMLQFEYNGDYSAAYSITDIQGRTILHGTLNSSKSINISELIPGIYFATLNADKLDAAPQKFVKL